ncbi:PE family protein [Mycobacterium szulgai]|nr:PE family protein [Mycobacterium szulgai]
MSFLVTMPDVMAATTASLASVGTAVSQANSAAAAATTGVLPPAADDVSAAIATLFANEGAAYQTLSTQAKAFHDRFVSTLAAAAGSYGSTEAASAGPLQTLEQDLLNAVNAPTQILFARH